jgi:Secretion system C-terminal sorting domain/Kelch motif
VVVLPYLFTNWYSKMKLSIFPLLLLLTLLTQTVNAQQWVVSPNTIVPTWGNCSAAYEGKIYFTGGVRSAAVTTAPYNDVLQIYDLNTGAVTVASGGLSFGRIAIGCVAHNGKIYFAGGYRYVSSGGGVTIQVYNNVDIYDISTDTWIRKNLSVARGEMGVAVVGGKIMFAGGVGTRTVVSSVVDIYDPQTDTWTTANLSEARSDCKAGVIGNKVWFCSGATDWLRYIRTTRVDVYDASSNTWSTTEVSLGREAGAVATVGKTLIFAGGYDQSSGTVGRSDRVDILDTETGIWTQAALSFPRMGLQAATLGNKAYFTGGGNLNLDASFLNTSSPIVDIFDASTGKWSTGRLNQPRMVHTCAAWGNKIVVGGGWYPEQSRTTGSIEVLTDPTIVVKTNEAKADEAFEVFPNPANGSLSIRFDEDPLAKNIDNIAVFDLNGRLVRHYPVPNTVLDIGGFARGIYLLKVSTKAGSLYTRRFVVVD